MNPLGNNNSTDILSINNMADYPGTNPDDESDTKPTTDTRAFSAEETNMNTIIQLIQRNRDEDQLERSRTRSDIADLKSALSALQNTSPMCSIDSPIINRARNTRRTSMFFGSPAPTTSDNAFRPTVQVLQHDIVYDNTLKVSSLEGLQFLSKQIQILTTRYPNHQISLARMVSINLREPVLAAYNHLWYKDSDISGSETREILVEDWLSLSNTEVQAILVEAARPRTRELCARELILFLGKHIPQHPPVNPDNFSKLFYGPMVKSLTDLQHLCSLLSADTSAYSNNLGKMPVPGYGTKDTPGQIQIWIISLGTQKDAILNWLGKDILIKQKNLESAIKYIRSKFMEGRNHSELRQDFDAKLTPIRYNDLRSTQGESYTRQQSSTYVRQPFHSAAPSVRQPFPSTASSKFQHQPQPPHRHTPSRSSLNALDLHPDQSTLDESHTTYLDEENDDDMTNRYEDTFEYPPTSNTADYSEYHPASTTVHYPDYPPTSTVEDYTISHLEPDFDHDLSAISVAHKDSVRQAISVTYQGYCADLFVNGTCPRLHSGCPFDHTAAALERCIKSFTLLGKRELIQHRQLPSWSPHEKDNPNLKRGSLASTRPDGPPTFTRNRDQHASDRNPGSYNQPKSYNK